MTFVSAYMHVTNVLSGTSLVERKGSYEVPSGAILKKQVHTALFFLRHFDLSWNIKKTYRHTVVDAVCCSTFPCHYYSHYIISHGMLQDTVRSCQFAQHERCGPTFIFFVLTRVYPTPSINRPSKANLDNRKASRVLDAKSKL